MSVIRDIVGKRCDLRFGTGKTSNFQLELVAEIAHSLRHIVEMQRPVMFDNPFERFPSQIETIKTRIAIFELRQNAKGLIVMREAAVRLHRFGKSVFARMAK